MEAKVKAKIKKQGEKKAQKIRLTREEKFMKAHVQDIIHQR